MAKTTIKPTYQINTSQEQTNVQIQKAEFRQGLEAQIITKEPPTIEVRDGKVVKIPKRMIVPFQSRTLDVCEYSSRDNEGMRICDGMMLTNNNR